ncbi:MAG: M28 family peptidase [Frankiaceae bacterium]|nr:M28 family peptidase [Frankiaceae bacterium]
MRSKSAVVMLAAAVLLPVLGHAAVAAPAAKGPKTLRDYPTPAVSGKQMLDGVDSFASAHPLRITGTPVQLAAADAIATEARSLGYTVAMQSYKGALTAVTATKLGATRPGEVIVFGGHFDSMVGTIYGTYDNATGVRTVMDLARSFAKVKTHRTMVFAWYNGEEEGALASEEMANDYKARGVKVTAYLGFDMVGIAYPVGGTRTDKNCLCMWRGARDEAFDQLLADVNYGFLRFPRGRQTVSIEGRNVRNSDEASWAAAGYPTLRWAGLRKAADYPEYHLPNDNLATMVSVAGGRSFVEAGLRNTLLSAYYTAAALDLRA